MTTFPLDLSVRIYTNTGELLNYQIVDTWHDGSPMTDGEVDEVIYIKIGNNYYKADIPDNVFNVEWFRIKFPSATDDLDLLQFAIETTCKLNATLRLEGKEYIVNEPIGIFSGYSKFRIIGEENKTLIKSNTDERFPGYYLQFEECQYFSIEKIQIDQNQNNITDVYDVILDYPADFNSGIYIFQCTHFNISHCRFLNLYNRAIGIKECLGEVSVKNNFFQSNQQEQMFRMEHLAIEQSHPAKITVKQNKFINTEPLFDSDRDSMASMMPCGITCFSCGDEGYVHILENYFEYCGRSNKGTHRLYALDFYDDVNNFLIDRNVFKNTTWGAIRFDGTRENGMITNNNIHQLISDNSAVINSTPASTTTAFRNINISNNILTTSDVLSYGILLQEILGNISGENITIHNNQFAGFKTLMTIGGNINTYSIIGNIGTGIIGIGISIDNFLPYINFDCEKDCEEQYNNTLIGNAKIQ